ncbi:MAG TPA: tannase/feruloyl esterase family alpha/beta hydrolase [Steroidobacteraceae bacterium]|nr:tannase/feruloyl esterase family alpha/beta hydrolase [Steroidobacteraceae bacterium]
MNRERNLTSVTMRLALAPLLTLLGGIAHAQNPVSSCDAQGIGSTHLSADGPTPQITSVSEGSQGAVTYCLVKVLVPQAIHIWIGLPMNGAWNGRWESVGGGVYVGSVGVPAQAIGAGYAAGATDTGHTGGRPGVPIPPLDGRFGMLRPGAPNTALQRDFAYRSEHLMAVIGKQLVRAFYGRPPQYSYWNGCSTGGRQGLRMAQDYPEDYDGILAGAPAIHWDRFQAAMLWYPMVALRDNGGPVGGGNLRMLVAKYRLATARAIETCDALDGVRDGVIDDPRRCHYLASRDTQVTRASCTANDPQCLTPREAAVIDKSWQGPVVCPDGGTDCTVPDVAARNLGGKGPMRLWYGQQRGTDLTALGGIRPFPVALEQARFWVYFDPSWDWHRLDYGNFLAFFRDTVERVGPMMASDNPDLSAFLRHGGKLVLWHGWADQLINPQGTIDYYDRVVRRMGGLARTRQFARLFMAPGVQHCGGGDGPQPQELFEAVVNWVEKGVAPQTILASKPIPGGTRTRPLCPYPAEARWNGTGSSDDAMNFSCVMPGRGR